MKYSWRNPGREIVLASASPRRKDILRKIGLEFSIVPAVGVNESRAFSEATGIYEGVKLAAERKAEEVAKQYKSSLVIGSDTVVLVDGEILFKPVSENSAFDMLNKLSGRAHQVVTGVTLMAGDAGYVNTDTTVTYVYFRHIPEQEIHCYLKNADYLDKAGAYAIQEQAAAFVERIEGCFYNVVGMPVTDTINMLNKFTKETGAIYG